MDGSECVAPGTCYTLSLAGLAMSKFDGEGERAELNDRIASFALSEPDAYDEIKLHVADPPPEETPVDLAAPENADPASCTACVEIVLDIDGPRFVSTAGSLTFSGVDMENGLLEAATSGVKLVETRPSASEGDPVTPLANGRCIILADGEMVSDATAWWRAKHPCEMAGLSSGCLSNRDCPSDAEACGYLEGQDVLCCAPGARGPIANGQPCQASPECSSGLCLGISDDKALCSDTCAADSDCPAELPKCLPTDLNRRVCAPAIPPPDDR